MNTLQGISRKGWVALAAALLLGAGLAGCSGDDGKDGATGTPGDTGATGDTGAPGSNGLNCWDLNGNGVADPATEDVNGDGKVDINDCRTPSIGYDPVSLHKRYVT